ncbi:MAG TPA: hypothetical protein VFE23_22010 [Usitatibacter sp.]|nr:hypothetical protein [Usitatibacter sp.]
MRNPSPFDAAFAWSRLGLQWMEMMTASAQVIAHRTRRRNTPAQFFTMGSEKVEAAVASSNAMARHLVAAPPTSALAAWDAWARMLTSGIGPYRTRARLNARRRRGK